MRRDRLARPVEKVADGGQVGVRVGRSDGFGALDQSAKDFPLALSHQIGRLDGEAAAVGRVGAPPDELHYGAPADDAFASATPDQIVAVVARIDPVNGRVRRFIGRSEGGIVVLDGLDEDPKERWSFRDITPDSFLWRGESSTDGGRSWFIEDEMLARRRGRSSHRRRTTSGR